MCMDPYVAIHAHRERRLAGWRRRDGAGWAAPIWSGVVARVVVVGAGLGGLAVAARLRVKGHEVTVIEAADTYGGALGTFRRDGFAFDTGPTTLTLPAVHRDLFAKTGGPLEAAVPLEPIEPGRSYHFADGTTLPMPGVGIGAGVTAMGEALGGRAAEDWRDLMARAARMWAAIRRPVLASPIAGPRDLLPLARDRAALRAIAPWQSLRGLGSAHLTDARARLVLEHSAWATDPRRAPAILASLPYVEGTFGAWHVVGGMRRLSDALHDRLLERGGTIRLATRATRIQLAAGRVCGVDVAGSGTARGDVAGGETRGSAMSGSDRAGGGDTGGTMLPADVVVSAVDASLLPGLLDGPGRSADANRSSARPMLARRSPASSALVLMLAVRGRTPDLGHETVWFPHDPDAELDACHARHARLPQDPTIHACVPDDPAMRPSDAEAWSIRVGVPCHSPGGQAPDVRSVDGHGHGVRFPDGPSPDGGSADGRRSADSSSGAIDWDAPGLADEYADLVLARLAERGTDLSGRILWRQLRTPADLERATGVPGGAIRSAAPTRRQALGAPNATRIPGLYQVGGSAHPGGGLPLVAMSAEIVADLVGRA